MHRQFVEISVKGEVDAASMADFDVTVAADRGVTRLRLMVRDDSVLYGLLDRLQSTGLEVLAVYPRDEFGDQPTDESLSPNTTQSPNESVSDDERT